jgi:uncharacterized protein YpmS
MSGEFRKVYTFTPWVVVSEGDKSFYVELKGLEVKGNEVKAILHCTTRLARLLL